MSRLLLTHEISGAPVSPTDAHAPSAPTHAGGAVLCERDLLRDDGTVNASVFLAIVVDRAKREHAEFIKLDPSWTFGELLTAECRRLSKTVAVMTEFRNRRAENAKRTPAERDALAKRLRAHIEKVGMGSRS